MIQEQRQDRIAKGNGVAVMTKLHAKTCPKKGKWRSRSPGLRRARDGISCRTAVRFADEAAEQFRQPPQILIGGSFEHRGKDLRRLKYKAIASEAKCDHRIIMWPDRAVVIGNRIETRLPICDRSNSPAAERVRSKQCPRDARRKLW